MSARNDVAPATVGVELHEAGVVVEYLDGHTTLYRGVPARRAESVTTPPGKEAHVLVTDPTETEGVMLYVNDHRTHDDILESTGVGRVVLNEGDAEEVFPGVTVSRPGGRRTAVDADPEQARGRVFVFVEDEFSERSYELVADEARAEGDADADDRVFESGDGETAAR